MNSTDNGTLSDINTILSYNKSLNDINENGRKKHPKTPKPERKYTVIREGYLHKESKTLKKTRKRFMVLTGQYLNSYKDDSMSEEPTEIFDLRNYRTAKMCRNGKIGEFEIISLQKQESRVFVAENKHTMNDWLKSIRKVMLFSQDFTGKCRSM